jgi:hypothetical protein
MGARRTYKLESRPHCPWFSLLAMARLRTAQAQKFQIIDTLQQKYRDSVQSTDDLEVTAGFAHCVDSTTVQSTRVNTIAPYPLAQGPSASSGRQVSRCTSLSNLRFPCPVYSARGQFAGVDRNYARPRGRVQTTMRFQWRSEEIGEVLGDRMM